MRRSQKSFEFSDVVPQDSDALPFSQGDLSQKGQLAQLSQASQSFVVELVVDMGLWLLRGWCHMSA